MYWAVAMAAFAAASASLTPPEAQEPRATPQRVLLLTDESTPSLEQHSVEQLLTSALLLDPTIELVTPEPLPPALQRADRLRRSALKSLARARLALETLEPFTAARAAAFATMRLERAAILSGDFGMLPESLGVLAAALLHLEAPTRATDVLMRLLTIAPDWQPDAGHYSPAMLAQLARARARLGESRTRSVRIDAGDAKAALFVDGRFVNFGAAEVPLTLGVPHFVWAQPEHGLAHGTRLDVTHLDDEPEVLLALPKAQELVHLIEPRFDALIAASLNPQGFVNAHSALIEGMRIDEVWVLGYDAGMVRLVAFELRSGRRHQVSTPALITHLSDVKGAVDTLLRRHTEEQSLAEHHQH